MKIDRFDEVLWFDGYFPVDKQKLIQQYNSDGSLRYRTWPLIYPLKQAQLQISYYDEEDDYGFIKYLCPCGCGQEAGFPFGLHSQGDHKWLLTRNEDGTITTEPSILMMSGCRSHYYIRHNRVDWC